MNRNVAGLAVLGLIACTLLSVGCGKPSGGGATSIDGNEVCYGIGEDGITFVVFTDIRDGVQSGTSASGGISSSQLSGYVQNESGRRFTYSSNDDSITIENVAYPFSNGRVLLISMSDEQLTVRQLNLPIESTGVSNTAMKEEIQRLSKEPDVATFLKESSGGND